MKKILCVTIMMLIGVFSLVSNSMAVSYEYTGNNFTVAGWPYTTDNFVSATLSFDNWLPANYSGDVTGFSGFSLYMIDGVEFYDSEDAFNLDYFFAEVSTNESRDIVTWELAMGVYTWDTFEVATINQPGVSVIDRGDALAWEGGRVANNPGTWTIVPEPISSTLFIVGSATLGFRRFWKKKRNI